MVLIESNPIQRWGKHRESWSYGPYNDIGLIFCCYCVLKGVNSLQFSSSKGGNLCPLAIAIWYNKDKNEERKCKIKSYVFWEDEWLRASVNAVRRYSNEKGGNVDETAQRSKSNSNKP